MTAPADGDTFYGSIPVFRGFASLMDPALYSPLPDDWTVGVADIVESTRAIAQARYKAVNMAGGRGGAGGGPRPGGAGLFASIWGGRGGLPPAAPTPAAAPAAAAGGRAPGA